MEDQDQLKKVVSFNKLKKENKSRMERWHGETEWSLADWSNAMCGEAGEAANIVKKIRRHQTSLNSNSYNTPPLEELFPALGKELADIVIYCDLLATQANINLEQAIIDKFNEVSEKQDFPERL